MKFKGKDLLSIEQLTQGDILEIFERASYFDGFIRNGKKPIQTLTNKCVATLFYENSTRTRVSFENAGKFLGAHTVHISQEGSSIKKGESIFDTVCTLKATGCDLVAIRHFTSGICEYLAPKVNLPIINAGDGAHAHPTQALLDAYTMQQQFKTFKGLNVLIVGDIKFSRVARSNIVLLNKMGAKVKVLAPPPLLPCNIEDMGVQVCHNLQQAVKGCDVVMPLRMQFERQNDGFISSLNEYSKFYRVSNEIMALANKNAILMHPAPINRGIELTSEVADSKFSQINNQVESGLVVRMALLDMLIRRV